MPAPRRVLIIAPHFPPVNAADSHRVRTALPYFRGLGWEPTVLTVDARDVRLAQDPLLERTVPSDAEVMHVRAWSPRVTRFVGLGSLALRARQAIRAAGDRLLRERRFDAVFFSTTEFPLLTLGLRWREKFGVPFVADWQDPWLNDHYVRTGQRPPGGKLKYALSQALARRGEPRVVRGAAHLVSVSSGYIAELAARYPDWNSRRATLLPFGAPVRDFALLDELGVAPVALPVPTDAEVWLSAGRGGADLHRAVAALFTAIAADRSSNPARWTKRRLVFLGTSYAPGAQAKPTIAPLAAQHGIGDLVVEMTQRAPYFATLAALRRADRLLVLGSDDAGYSASKVLPYVLAGRPVLALLHEQSGAADFLRKFGSATVLPFASTEGADSIASRLTSTGWLQSPAPCYAPTDSAVLAPFTAEAMAARLGEIFSRAAAENAP